MFIILSCILIGGWLMAMGWKFYRNIDWAEPADPSPDLHGMHKREAQLMHIQDVLEEAHSQGKISKMLVDEFNRFCEKEFQEMRGVETAWKNRYKTNKTEV